MKYLEVANKINTIHFMIGNYRSYSQYDDYRTQFLSFKTGIALSKEVNPSQND